MVQHPTSRGGKFAQLLLLARVCLETLQVELTQLRPCCRALAQNWERSVSPWACADVNRRHHVSQRSSVKPKGPRHTGPWIFSCRKPLFEKEPPLKKGKAWLWLVVRLKVVAWDLCASAGFPSECFRQPKEGRNVGGAFEGLVLFFGVSLAAPTPGQHSQGPGWQFVKLASWQDAAQQLRGLAAQGLNTAQQRLTCRRQEGGRGGQEGGRGGREGGRGGQEGGRGGREESRGGRSKPDQLSLPVSVCTSG